MGAPSSDKAAIKKVVKALVDAGYVLREVVYDYDEREPVRTKKQAVDAITDVSSASLVVSTDDGEHSYWVWFVLGNDPEEVVCDHHISLSHVLDPLMRSWS